jgi:hypothetical protein
MNIVTLLEELDRRGVVLRVGRTEDRLNATPRGVLDETLVAALREHKQDLIQLVRDHEELQQTGVLQNEHQVLEEFREVSQRRETHEDPGAGRGAA